MSAYAKRIGERLGPGVAGEVLTVGQLVFLASDGQWELADANAAGESPAEGVVTMAASAAGAAVEVCKSALIGGLSGLTVGAKVYLSETPGAITETAPTGNAKNVQKVGYNVSATEQMVTLDQTQIDSDINDIAATLTGAEMSLLDGTIAGTAVASKVLALGASKDVDTIDVTALKLGGVAVSSTAADLNKLAGWDPAGVVRNVRVRCTAAEIGAGKSLVAVASGYKFRLVDAAAIAYGGAVATVTTIDILAGVSKLVAFVQANLTQSTVITAGGTGGTVLADGASYVAQADGVDITIGKTGGAVETATGVDIILSYVIETA